MLVDHYAAARLAERVAWEAYRASVLLDYIAKRTEAGNMNGGGYAEPSPATLKLGAAWKSAHRERLLARV